MNKLLLLISTAILLSIAGGCLEKPDTDGKGGGAISPIGNVPQTFDWRNIHDIALTICVNDQYDGKYKYLAEVFIDNPIIQPTAKIVKAISINGSETISISIPRGISALYVRQTDPLSRQTVQAIQVTGKALKCDFAPISTNSTQAFAGNTYAVQAPKSTISKPTPPNAIAISGSNNVKLLTGNSYVVKAGATYTGDLTFPGEGNAALYVEGTCTIDQKSITLQTKSEIVVQSTGVMTISGSTDIKMINQATITVMKDGRFEAANSDIALTDIEGAINNLGTMRVNDIEFSTHATLLNDGTLTINDELSCSNSTQITNNGTANIGNIDMIGGTLDNNGLLVVGDIEMNSNNAMLNNNATLNITEQAEFQNTTVNNDCLINVFDGAKVVFKAATLNLGDNSRFTCEDVVCQQGTTTINIGALSIYEVRNEMKMGSNNNIIQGAGKNSSLARIKHVFLNGHMCVTYRSVQIECDSHTQNNNAWDKKYVLEETASMKGWGKSDISIPESKCSGTGNIPDSGTGDGSESDQGSGDVTYDNKYTFLMEDNWPKMGDYDMNDAVIELTNYIESPKNKTITLNFRLLALGASKQIRAGIQLDGIAPSQVESVSVVGGTTDPDFALGSNGLENNQDFAVFQLFVDAHRLLEPGSTHRKPINTGKIDGAEPKSIRVDITFKNSDMIKEFTIGKLNLFIVTGNTSKDGKRQEIHMRGYNPTSLADHTMFGKEDDKSLTVPYMAAGNLVWSIIIPDHFAYPLESKSISIAYPDFDKWVSSGGGSFENWYANPDSGFTHK